MEGLEAAVVRKSQLGEYLRVDSEFYQKQYLVLDEVLRTALPLTNFISHLTDGTHVTPKYQEDGVKFLSSGNVSEFEVDFDDVRYIGEDEHKRLSHCQPQAGDVLISKSGRIGHAAVVPDNVTKGEFNIYEGIALLRTIEIAPLTLAAIINSSVVQSQINRRFKGVAQPHLHLEDIRRLRIPLLSKSLSESISDCVNRGRNLTSYSTALLKDAEGLLNKSLGLSDWQPPQPLTYTRRASETFAAERLDAEHFQPQYDAMLERATQHAAYTRRVADFVLYCDRGEQPDYVEDGTLDVVNSRHILESGLDYGNFEKTDLQCLNDARFAKARIQKNDILVYTTGAKIGRSGIYFADTPALASNHVNILRVSEENPLYVGAVMNSMIGRWQTRRQCTGSAQVEIYPAVIARFVIPFVDTATQETIAEKMRESYAARHEAKALLEVAKRAVEIAIEQDENAALDWLLRKTSAQKAH